MRSLVLILLFLAIFGCQRQAVNLEAKAVFAVIETDAVSSAEDAADDPAIWINSSDPEQSLILGTNKQKGLAVYNLQGREVQFLPRGRLNNIDLRNSVQLNAGAKTIAVATNRSQQTLDVFSISDQGVVEHIYEQPVSLTDPYGVCMYLDQGGGAHVFANSKDGEYQQWLLNPEGELAPQLLGSFRLASQPEGCAVDDATATLYMGEENYGIWMMTADASAANERTLLDSIEQGNIAADVEGMDVYRSANNARVYLIASSQGNDSYVIYDLLSHTYVGAIRVEDNPDNGIDGTQETDGLAVSSVALGSRFPDGVLVVQDGFNESPKENQNFKLISWRDVEQLLVLPD